MEIVTVRVECYARRMTENKLNPFEDNEEEYVSSVANDAVELASERRERRKIDTTVSDHAPVRHTRIQHALN